MIPIQTTVYMARSHIFHPDFPFAPRKAPIFYGWIILGASTLGVASSIPGQTVGVGPFKEPLQMALGLTSMHMSVAYLIGTTGGGLLLPKIGGIFDRFGARPMGFYSQIAFALALFFMAGCDHIYHYLHPEGTPWPWLAFALVSLGFFLIRFIGQGVVTLTARALIGKWFNVYRGMASAIGGSFTAIFFGSAPAILYGLKELAGWRGAWVVCGLFMLVVMSLLSWLLFRDNPEECGLVMDGKAPPPEPAGKTDPELTVHREFTAEEAIRTYPFWVFTAAFCLNGIYATAFNFHASDIARENSMTEGAFFGLFPYMMMINIPIGFLIGWLTSKVRLRYCLAIMAASMGISAAGITALASFPGKAAFVIGGGIAWGCFGTLMSVMYPRFFGRRHLGKISGWSMLALVLASAVAPLLYSLSLEFTGKYAPASWGVVAAAVVIFIASFRADNPQRKLAKEETL